MAVFQMPAHRFHPTRLWVEILNFYKGLNADCFISLGANEVSHEMVAYAHILGLPSVVGIASDQSLKDSVFQGSMISNDYEIPSFHAWEAMHLATSVLVQTQWQKDWLYRKVGRRGCLVPNPIPAGWGGTYAPRDEVFSFDFLWVGRSSPDKNPEIIFEVARELDSATFRMIVDGGLAAINEPWRSHLPGNVILTDRVDTQEELQELMRSSRAIVSSSPMEGFPNIMLQGATVGCPCIFLNVDPDGWCAEHGCAASAHGDVEQFLTLLRRALNDSEWLETLAQRAFQRTTEHHSPEVVRGSLLGALNQALDQVKKARV